MLNKRRFALSLAIVCAIGVPIYTGSAKQAYRQASIPIFEDDEYRYLAAHGMNPYTCMVGKSWGYSDEDQRKTCDEIKNLAGQNRIVRAEFNPKALLPLLRDVLLGLLAPFLLLFLIPPIGRLYWRWVSEHSK